jgi:hypothetical protein
VHEVEVRGIEQLFRLVNAEGAADEIGNSVACFCFYCMLRDDSKELYLGLPGRSNK